MTDVHQQGETVSNTVFGQAAEVKLSQPVIADRELIPQTDATNDAPDQHKGKQSSGSAPLWFIISGGVVAIFWLSGVMAFTLGQSGISGLLALPVSGLASLGFVALGPALFIMLAAVLIAELARFRNTARYIGAMAARFADPAKATREDARLMAEAVRAEMGRVNGAVEGALARLGAMEEVLGHHSEAFASAEKSARERTDVLINDLRREREAVADLAIVLDQKAADIASAITEQSKMVVAAADIANAHAIDSTKTLEESAERLSGSAHDAAQGAKVIAAKLDDASGRLSSNTIALGDVSTALDTTTKELDQVHERAKESFATTRTDARILTDLTRQSVEQMHDVAKQGAQTITEAFDAALNTSQASVRDVQLRNQITTERNAEQAEALKQAAQEARDALDAYAEVIAKRLEQANEASFSAASWADKTFEKLEQATRKLEGKLAALPETADAQAQDLQDKLRKGLEGLNEAARSAAEEAEEIDAGFQARIRQNYELLSDFMLRMGAAADTRSSAMDIPSPFLAQAQTAPAPTPTQPAQPAPDASPKVVAPAPDAKTSAKPEKPKKKSFIEAQIEAQNALRSKTGHNKTDKADEASLETEKTAEKATEKPAHGWSWKDVLSGMDKSKEPATTGQPGPQGNAPAAKDSLDRLVTLFRIYDIDPPSLFTTQVYRSLAHARLVGGHSAMTEVVHLEAGQQVKTLRDAFADDEALRKSAEDFAFELRDKINQSAEKGNKMRLETHLRTGDGPAYLLIETALR
jgi:hypothetical protein